MKKSIQSLFCLLAVFTLCSTYTTAMPRKKTKNLQTTTESEKYADVAEGQALSATYTSPAAGGPSTTDTAFGGSSRMLRLIHQAHITQKEDYERQGRENAAFLADQKAKELQLIREHKKEVETQKRQHAMRQIRKQNKREQKQAQLEKIRLKMEAEKNREINAQYSEIQRAKNLALLEKERKKIEGEIAEELALESAFAASKRIEIDILQIPFKANQLSRKEQTLAKKRVFDITTKQENSSAYNTEIIEHLRNAGSINPSTDINNARISLVFLLAAQGTPELFNAELFGYILSNISSEDIINLETEIVIKSSNGITNKISASLLESICIAKNKEAFALLFKKHPSLYSYMQTLQNSTWLKAIFIRPDLGNKEPVDTSARIINMLETIKNCIQEEDARREREGITERVGNVYSLLPQKENAMPVLHKAIELDFDETIIDYLLSQPEHAAVINKKVLCYGPKDEDNVSDDAPITAAHIAIKYNRTHILRKLYEHGADFTIICNNKSLLSEAMHANNPEILLYLLSLNIFSQAEIEKTFQDSLYKNMYNTSLTNMLLAKLTVLTDKEVGYEALKIAVRNNDVSMTTALLKKGVNPDQKTNSRTTIFDHINFWTSQDGIDRTAIKKKLLLIAQFQHKQK